MTQRFLLELLNPENDLPWQCHTTYLIAKKGKWFGLGTANTLLSMISVTRTSFLSCIFELCFRKSFRSLTKETNQILLKSWLGLIRNIVATPNQAPPDSSLIIILDEWNDNNSAIADVLIALDMREIGERSKGDNSNHIKSPSVFLCTKILMCYFRCPKTHYLGFSQRVTALMYSGVRVIRMFGLLHKIHTGVDSVAYHPIWDVTAVLNVMMTVMR